MEPTTTAVLTSYAGKALLPVFKAAITKGLALAWRAGAEEAKVIFQKLEVDEAARRYCDYAQRILKIRTILDPDTVHDIPNIYHPLSAKSKDGEPVSIESLSDIVNLAEGKEDKIFVNLVGKAGQGKSTSFKYIFGKTLTDGEKVPFYFNLREFGSCTIEEELFKEFSYFVHDVEIGIFKLLLQSKRVIIFLDGFDEIESSKRGYWLKEIDRLSIRYMVDILVSSRPDTEICRGLNVENISLCDLSKDDMENIIRKNAKDCLSALEYISIVDANETLEGLLVSPILVMLFMSTYHMLDTVPDTVSRFYEEIFICLYKKHDKLDKPGFPREVRSKIIEYDAKECFSAFCFLSFKKSDYGYSEESMRDYFKDALDLCGFDVNEADRIKSDVVNITNLIVNDGHDRYSYIHRSIQEYYTARYIKGLPENNKKSFYDRVVSNAGSRILYGKVIEFLSDIDQDFYEKNFVLEIFKNIGIVDLDNGSYISHKKANFRSNLSGMRVTIATLDDQLIVESLGYFSNKAIPSLDWVCTRSGWSSNNVFGIGDMMDELSKHPKENVFDKFDDYLLDTDADTGLEDGSFIRHKDIPVDVYLIKLGVFDHFYRMYLSTCKYLYENQFKIVYERVKSRDERMESLDF